jgi:uncharacterized membrane protein
LRDGKLNESLETINALRSRAQHGVSAHQRWIERLTAALGRPMCVYLVIAGASLWVGFNMLSARLGMTPLDRPPFPWMQGVVSLCALLTTITILTSENRQTREAEERAHLDLQINLLAEQKIAKVIDLLEELRRDMPTVRDRVDKVAETMKEPVDPRAVLAAIKETFETAVETESEAEEAETEAGDPEPPSA